MNPILIPTSPILEAAPNRYYALVDSVETVGPDGRGERLVQLDGVSADEFDRSPAGTSLFERLGKLQLALMDLSSDDAPPGWLFEKTTPAGTWVEVTAIGSAVDRPVAPEPGAPLRMNVDFYRNLFGNAVTLLSDIRVVEAKLAAKLDLAFSLNDVPDARASTIQRLLRERNSNYAVVLDVGQGNATALCAAGSAVQVYFDFGSPVKANSATFPKTNFRACFASQPPVVMSHWDYDHWSCACRWTDAMKSHWIAPRSNRIGVSHLAFASELHRRGRLHIWPNGLTRVSTNCFRVEKCTGSDRNDSGLAMIFGAHGAADALLLPGDAAYECIPSVRNGQKFAAAVASHHGARVSSLKMLKPSKATAAMVYSVGHGNYYGHPALHACLSYLEERWAPENTASTAQHRRNRPNTIGIAFGPQPRQRSGCGVCDPKIWLRP